MSGIEQRVTALEIAQAQQVEILRAHVLSCDRRYESLQETLEGQTKSLNQVVSIIDKGQGGLRALFWVGGVLVTVAGAIAWLVDHIPSWLK